VQNYELHFTQNPSKYFDYPIQQYDMGVFPYQYRGEEVEDTELKAKQ
jgi:hypothetical protein